MKFSLITCTYNRSHYLRRTLESVGKQNFDTGDYEIIVIDNNSTDDTLSVAEKFIESYPEKTIRYFREENQGLSFALNRGIKEAEGDYLIFVDDDETIGEDHLLRLEHHLKKYPEAELIASPVVPVYETQKPSWMSHYTRRLIEGYFYQGDNIKKLSSNHYPGTGHTIIKRDLYEQYGYYNTELGRKGTSLIGAEDKDMFQRLKNNHVGCCYFPDIPIYHHIPASKLTDDFFDKLTYSVGKSERIRTKSVSRKSYLKRLAGEAIKWMASIFLFFVYTLTFRPSKGVRLLRFRRNVTRGLLGL